MIDWSVVEAAHHYVDQGWPVLPLYAIRSGSCTCGKADCSAPGKHPRTVHGVKDATLDHVQVDTWFKNWPESNVGIATGQRSGVSVVDVDPRNGGFDSIVGLDLPPTRMAETGSGGFHYFYSHSGPIKQHVLAPGVDLKADGGYVVAAPSNHIAGSYTWLNENESIAAAPPFCLNGRAIHLVQSPTIERTENGSIRILPDGKEHFAEKLLSIHPKGARHADLISLAGYFANVLPKAVALAILTQWGARSCDPPLRADWVKTHVDDAYERWHSPEQESVDYWTAQSLLDADFPPLRWVVDKLLPEGLVFLAGRPKRGKSYAALQIAIDVVSGRHSFGPTTTGKVIYIALEDSARRLQLRLQQMKAPRSHDLIILNHFPYLDEGGTTRLVEMMEEHKPILVVIDTFSRAVTSKVDGNDISAITGVLGPLQALAMRMQVCVLLIDHHRKPGDNPGDMIDDIAGSTAKVAVADAILGLYRKHSEDFAVLKLTGRDVEERDIALRWHGLTFQWSVESGAPLNSAERQIVGLISNQGQIDAAEIASEMGMSERTIGGMMRGLRDRGVVNAVHIGGKVGHPRYVYSLTDKSQ